MIKYSIEFLPQAYDDIESIADTLAQFYKSTVSNFRSSLEKKIEQICTNPFSCPISLYSEKFRLAIIDDNILYYEVNESTQMITVYIVIHSSRDIENFLSKLLI